MIKLILPVLIALSTSSKKPVTYVVNTTESVIEWEAKKVTGQHNGKVPLSGGQIVVDGKKLVSGSFEANMAGLKVEELNGNGNPRLDTHLKSDDFFSTEKFPSAIFTMSSATEKGPGQYEINGNLVIKGITKPVSFTAAVAPATGGTKLLGTATFNIDRTKYDIKYRSSNWFEGLGDKAIYDDFQITVKLVLDKQ